MRSFWARLALVALPLLYSACGDAPLASEEDGAELDGVEAALTESPACSPDALDDRLTWSSESATDEACEGEWNYLRYNRCSVTSSLCGTYCPAWNRCRDWAFGRDATNQRLFRTQGMMNIPRKCTERCVRKVLGICVDHETTCVVDSAWASNKCAQWAEDFRSFYYNYGNYVGSFVESSWMTAYAAGQNNTYTGTCNYWLSIPQAAERADSRCGCATAYQPRTCPLYHPSCGSVRVTSALNLTYAQADAVVGSHPGDAPWDTIEGIATADLKCTSCESLPLPASVTSAGASELVQRKYGCLEERRSLATTSAQPITDRNEVYLYERWGELLTDAQRAASRALYVGFDALPTVATCGPVLDVPALPATCDAATVSQLGADLRRCQRLAGSHVSEKLSALELTSCTAALDAIAQKPLCVRSQYPETMSTAVSELLQKQFGLIAHEPAGLGALPNQLRLVDAWYRASTAAGARPTGEELERVLTLFRLALEEHYKTLDVLDAALGGSSDAIQTALGTAAANGRAMDQTVLNALFTPVAGALPLSGVPLAHVAGDALSALLRRLDDLAPYHDFACSFRTCGPNVVDTPLAYGFRLLASLDDAAKLNAALSSSQQTLSGYRAIVQKMYDHHAAVRAALTGPATADTPLAQLISTAKSRYGNFEQEGRFRGMKSDLLHAGLTAAEREDVISVVRQQASQLRQSTDTYDAQLTQLFSSVMAQIDTGASADRVRDEIALLAEQLDDLGVDLAGLRANFGAHQQRFSRHLIESSIRDQMSASSFFQLGESQRFDFNGASARYDFVTDPNHTFAVSSVSSGQMAGQRGQMLLIETSGQYAPTCALRRLSGNILPPRGSSPVPVNVSGALTGPEGFTITFSNGTYKAESSTTSETTTAGVRAEVCAGGSAPGYSAEACAYVGHEWSWSDSESDGEETRTSASFETGLRLKSTPFPNQGAGALLVVLTDPVSGAVQEVRAVHAPQTAIFLEQDTVAHLVVNDEFDPALCTGRDTSHTLVVNATPMASGPGAAQLLAAAMAEVVDSVRESQDAFVAQGRILPGELDAVRTAAIDDLSSELDVETLPAALYDIFNEFLSAELAQLQRRVEILNVERQRKQLVAQIRTLHKVLVAADANAYLAKHLPQRLLRRLQARVLEHQIGSLQALVEEYLEPVLELWYPRVYDLYRNSPQIGQLLGLGLDSGVEDAAAGVHTLVEGVLQSLAVAQLGYKGQGSTLPLVAVSFVKPGTPEVNPITGQRQLSNLRKADEGRAQDVWDAIEGRTTAQIQIRPEDIYGSGANRTDFTLSCAEHVPVVYKLAGFFSGFAQDVDGELNDLSRNFDAYPASGQPYADASGLVPYQLVNDVWQRSELPILYGTFTNIQSVFNSDHDVAAQRPVGLSPFGTVGIDFAAFDGIESNGGVTGVDEKFEFILIMQVDSRPDGHDLSWVTSCQ